MSYRIELPLAALMLVMGFASPRALAQTQPPNAGTALSPEGDRKPIGRVIPLGTCCWEDATSGVLGNRDSGRGVAFVDLDHDGDLDLYLVVDERSNLFLRNDGGGAFNYVRTLPQQGISTGAAFGDLEGDGDFDVFLSSRTERQLWVQNANGNFTQRPWTFSLGGGANGRFADLDNDGYLDLFVLGGVTHVLQNIGTGELDPRTDAPLGRPMDDAVLGDLDDDGDLDMFVASVAGNALFRNEGQLQFVDVTHDAIGPTGRSYTGLLGDLDNDGDLDLVTISPGWPNRLWKNDGSGRFDEFIGGALAVRTATYGATLGDFDNDGDLDLFEANHGPNRYLMNLGDGWFADQTSNVVGEDVESWSVTTGDADDDGDLDLYVSNCCRRFSTQGVSNRYYLNAGLADDRHWLKIDLRGFFSNRYGVGARIQIFAGAEIQMREVTGHSGHMASNPLTAHFGFGERSGVDSIVVRWPSGQVQTIRELTPSGVLTPIALNRTLVIEENPQFPGGSPFAEHVVWTDATHAPLGSTGGLGVAFGDVDEDDDLDLYVGKYLYRNDGRGQFDLATEPPLGDPRAGIGAAFGDVDNDGRLDLYQGLVRLANRLYLNGGDGRFADVTSGGLLDWGEGITPSFVDYDNDGDLDIFFTNGGHGSTSLHRNDGNGHFANVTAEAFGVHIGGQGAAFGDVDADGDQDLFVTTADGSPNVLFRNLGDGRFVDATPTWMADTEPSYGADFGDVDGDGDLDLYVARHGQRNRLFLNSGAGFFFQGLRGPFEDAGLGKNCALVDVDNDGDLDIYVSNDGPNRLFLNLGANRWEIGRDELINDAGISATFAFGDVDADGDLDVYLTNGGGPDRLLLNGAEALEFNWLRVKLEGTVSNRSGIGARVRVVADSVSQIREIKSASGWASQGALAATFGLRKVTEVDSVIVRWPSGVVQILTGEPAGTAIAVNRVLHIVEPGEREPPAWAEAAGVVLGNRGAGATAVLADIDGDDDLDLYLVNQDADHRLFENDGTGSFEDATRKPFEDERPGQSVLFGDLDSDGLGDLYVGREGGANRWLRNLGGGDFEDAAEGGLADAGATRSIAAADVDRDGDIDLLLVNADRGPRLLRNEGAGHFVDATPQAWDGTDAAQSAAFADIDNDGDQDLYVVHGSGVRNVFYRNDGASSFVALPAGTASDLADGRSAAFGDIDNDGDLDLYLVNATTHDRLFANAGNGVFVDVTADPLKHARNGRVAHFVDVDNDGWLDLYVVHHGEADRLYQNMGGHVFVDVTHSTIAAPNAGEGVTFGDVDRDGDLDLYVVNGPGESNQLLRNDHFAAGNHWLHVRLAGTQSNPSGIGARVEVTSDGQRWTREVSAGSGSPGALTAAFGLGTTAHIDTVIVRWPSGITQILDQDPSRGGDIRVDQALVIVEAQVPARWTNVADGAVADPGASRGVALSDVDGDGDFDLFWTSATQGANRLFLNNDLVFEDATDAVLRDVGPSFGAAWADIDNDADADLYVSDGQNGGRLFENLGGARFRDITGDAAVRGLGRAVAFGDIDGDGDVDLYVTHAGSANRLYRNEGAGEFIDFTHERLGDPGDSRAAVFTDWDLDGDRDLYVVNHDSPNRMFRNIGSGVFIDVSSPVTADEGFGQGVVAGDVDNDGDPDLYLSNDGPNRLLRNEGGGVFVDATVGPLGDAGRGTGVAMGDLDNDGDLDLYLSKSGPNRVLLNDGTGRFSEGPAGVAADVGQGQGVALGDLDGDGDLDICLANSGLPNRIFRNDLFAFENNWFHVRLIGTQSNRSALGARVRIVAAGRSQAREISGASGYFSQDAPVAAFGLGRVSIVDSLIVRWPSGAVQVLTSSGRDPFFSWLKANSLLTLQEPRAEHEWVITETDPLGFEANAIGVSFADIDNDGDQDLWATNGTPDRNRLFRNLGDGSFVDATLDAMGTVETGLAGVFGDYDNDGHIDLFQLYDYAGPGGRLYRNLGGGVFDGSATPPLDEVLAGQSAAWSDLDLDGDLDLYVANYRQPNRLYRNDGPGGFVDVASGALGTEERSSGVAFGDIDDDGDPDLYVTNSWRGVNEPDHLFRNEGGGVFADLGPLPFNDQSRHMGPAFGDVDNDGDLDLFVAGFRGGSKLYRNEGGGAFVDATHGPLHGIGGSRSAAFGDVDNDGDLDLFVTATRWGNKLFFNHGDGTFSDGTVYPLTRKGEGFGTAFADTDLDGDLDLYVAMGPGVPNRFFENRGVADGHHWLHVDLTGTRSNRSAIGARVRIVSGGRSQIREVSGGSGFASQNSLRVEFGLGLATAIDTLTVRWPSGTRQTIVGVAADQILAIEEHGGPEPIVSPSRVAPAAPVTFALGQGAPNPFTDRTIIEFAVPRPSPIELRVYDLNGRLIQTLVPKRVFSAGRHRVEWNGVTRSGGRASPGVYFYSMKADGFEARRRLVLLR